MARLPSPGGDNGNWGTILNDYLSQIHTADGTLKPSTVAESALTDAVQTKLNAPSDVTSVNTQTGDVTLTKTDVGLGNVDNTSDANKPVSTAQAAADAARVLVTDDFDGKFRTPATVQATITRLAAAATAPGGTTGSVCAGLVVCRSAGTYTQVRVFIGATGTGVTGIKIGAWNSTGVTNISETPNFVASLVANSWTTQTLTNPLTLGVGDQIYLGVGMRYTTTGPGVRGVINGVPALWPQTLAEGPLIYRGLSGGSWTSDAGVLPGNLSTSSGPGLLYLVELLP